MHFILVRVKMNLKPIPGILGVKSEYILEIVYILYTVFFFFFLNVQFDFCFIPIRKCLLTAMISDDL